MEGVRDNVVLVSAAIACAKSRSRLGVSFCGLFHSDNNLSHLVKLLLHDARGFLGNVQETLTN